jgi:hypothetical protein
MTKMSDPHAVTTHRFTPNCVKGQVRSHLVHGVHRSAPVLYVVAFLLLGACVIPPSLSVEGDGGVGDSPPAILALSSDQQQLTQPGPASFGVGQMSTAIVSMVDTDLNDTLFVRWFVDYSTQNPLPARVECFAPPSGSATRSAQCDLHTLCVQKDVGVERDLSIVVFDRPLMDPGNPPFQQMQPGGISSSWFFHLACFQ